MNIQTRGLNLDAVDDVFYARKFLCFFLPQMNQFAQFGRQTSQLVVGQIQRTQINQLPDVAGQPQQIVVVQIQCGEMIELP